jgi:CubicO group peptidase (beta-lactamase class C family)
LPPSNWTNASRLEASVSDAIDTYVFAEMRRQRIPGMALGIYKNGSIVLAKGYGKANLELNVPMTADSVLQSGSVGKSFTATALMMLVERGKVKLDDSIRDYFPEGPDSWKEIRIANLLSHTSGLAAYDDPQLQLPDGPFDIRRDYSEDELVAAIGKLPHDFDPGDDWAYKNTNFVLLGILIHRVTGQPYGEFLAQNIFRPLGMMSSSVISDQDIVPNRVSGYEMVGGVLKNQQWVSPTFNSTADGTLYFTVRDLEQWDRALCGENLLKAASLEKMWTPYPYGGKSEKEGYGFGWRIQYINGRRVIGHNGAWQGFSTSFSRYVDDTLTIVALCNLDAMHCSPVSIVRAVAGIISPSLEVPERPPIADDREKLTASSWAQFCSLMNGDITGKGTQTETFSAEQVRDLQSSLPVQWGENFPVLIERTVEKEGLISVYKIGNVNDTRLLRVLSLEDEGVASFSILADPDNR